MRKNILLLIILLCGFSFTSYAQTKNEARALFQEGKYKEAKEAYADLLSKYPNQSEYNYFFGRACLALRDYPEAIDPLLKASKRNYQDATFHLAWAYNQNYQYEKAIDTLENYIRLQKRRRKDTEKEEERLAEIRKNFRMLKGVEQVCVIDSFIVDKESFLSNYRVSDESGFLYMYNEYFNKTEPHEGVVYEAERGNKIYYADKDEQGIYNIYTQNRLLNEWGKPKKLPEIINDSVDTNYPFMATDGITFYYASKGQESMGGYDIFVTRYNTQTDGYLRPENVGMPFNSPYNDYMYALDEFNDLGWFVSDRFQPEDKVCIYVFIPNRIKQTYNFETMNPEELVLIAQLRDIRKTWTDEALVQKGLDRLAQVIHQRPKEKQKVDFTFIIDDSRTYHFLSDFQSDNAKTLFQKQQQFNRDLEEQRTNLEVMREQFQNGTQTVKEQLRPAILDLEKRVNEMQTQLMELIKDIRKTEKQAIK